MWCTASAASFAVKSVQTGCSRSVLAAVRSQTCSFSLGAGPKVDEERCRQAAQLFANLWRAGKSGLATAHLGRGLCTFTQLMMMHMMQQDEVSCFTASTRSSRCCAMRSYLCMRLKVHQP